MLRKRFDVYKKAKSFVINGGKEEKELFNEKNTLKTFEYAAFQKRLFNEKKKQKKRNKILIIIAIVLAVIILLFVPYLIKFVFGDGYLTYELN